MNRKLMNRYLAAGLVASTLGFGCSHAPTQPSLQGSDLVQSGPSSARKAAESSKKDLAAGTQAEGSAITARKPQLAGLDSAESLPRIETLMPAGHSESQAQDHQDLIQRTGSSVRRGEAPPSRKGFADISALPSFGHADDYSWLSGQVEYSRLAKGWRLRYASVDEVDPYGGSVTLAENAILNELKDGQCVRVQGRLINSEGKSIAPLFHVESIQPVEN